MTAIGIDLGGTNIKGVLMNAGGDVIRQAVAATQSEPDPARTGTSSSRNAGDPRSVPGMGEGPAPGSLEGGTWKETVAGMVAELKTASPCPVEAVGLAAPGLANDTNSAIRIMPGRLQGLENFVWSDYLGLQQTWVLNDAHAALMAEARFGAGKGVGNIVMLTWGTGIGGGILIDGKLYSGNYQMAGHLGHMTLEVNKEDAGITGMPGTLENAIGDATVSKRSFGRFSSTLALVEAYRKGDTFATFVWLNTVRNLALGIRSLCNLLSPDLVILGGGVTKAGTALYGPLDDFLNVYEWKNAGRKTPLRQAQYSDMAGAVGAAGFALERTNAKAFGGTAETDPRGRELSSNS